MSRLSERMWDAPVGEWRMTDPTVLYDRAGAVTRVEITRSSGYTEVDAGVEAALREFLFSRVEGGNDAVGTITFRFRLEKRD